MDLDLLRFAVGVLVGAGIAGYVSRRYGEQLDRWWLDLIQRWREWL